MAGAYPIWFQKLLSSTAGMAIVLLVSGRHVIHPILGVLLQICLLQMLPNKIVHWASFVAGFAHLFYFRFCGGLPFMPDLGCAPAHTNAIQMIMTLKVCIINQIHKHTQ